MHIFRITCKHIKPLKPNNPPILSSRISLGVTQQFTSIKNKMFYTFQSCFIQNVFHVIKMGSNLNLRGHEHV